MDHLSHPVPGQSQATNHQPHLHRRPRPSTLGTQRRLPGRVLRRRSPHRFPSDLRRHLRTFAGWAARNSRAAQDSAPIQTSAAERNSTAARDSRSALASAPPNPQIPPALPRPPQLHPQLAFFLADSTGKPKADHDREGHDFSRAVSRARSTKALAAEVSSRLLRDPTGKTGSPGSQSRQTSACLQLPGRSALQRRLNPPESAWPSAPAPVAKSITSSGSQPLRHNCECTMNSLCGKPIPHPRTKPVIAEDTTYGVSLLTGTISGSNFAIP